MALGARLSLGRVATGSGHEAREAASLDLKSVYAKKHAAPSSHTIVIGQCLQVQQVVNIPSYQFSARPTIAVASSRIAAAHRRSGS
jgi:hypothetical protein